MSPTSPKVRRTVRRFLGWVEHRLAMWTLEEWVAERERKARKAAAKNGSS